MYNFKDLMRFDAKSCESQADELRRWSRQFNRRHHKVQTKPAVQIIASPESGISCDKPVDSLTVTPSSTSSTCPDETCDSGKSAQQIIASPVPGIRRDKVSKCETAAVVPDDGPAVSTCPDKSSDSARVQLPSCDRRQDASQVRKFGTGSDSGKKPEDHMKKEIFDLESNLLELWNGSPSNLLIRRQEEEIFSLQHRVDLLEETCREKDKIIMKHEKKLDRLSEQDQAMWELQEQQKNLVSSLLAKASVEKKTKFIQGTRKLRYQRTGPTVPVQRELVKASTRLLEERHKKQKEDVDKLVSIVDSIAINYPAAPSPDPASADKYSFRSIILTNPVKTDDESCVTEVYKAICLYAVDTTKEEDDEYDAFLHEQDRPPIIYSPVLLKPRVEWHRINTNVCRNLPKPKNFPVYGAAQDPAYYESRVSVHEKGLMFDFIRPFGAIPGFRTSCGIMAVPEEAVNGFKWDVETKDWVIAAF